MLVRRTLAAAAAALTLTIATAGVASAQDGEESPPTSAVVPTSAVLPTSEVQDPGTAPIPTTGSDVLPTVLLGAGFAGAGAALVVVSRRRRNNLIPA